MTREIKFRAWNNVTKTMHFPDWEELAIRAGLAEMILIQYTGLKDKNGDIDIYECDIIGLDGMVKGNIYEALDQQRTDLVITGMGTKEWRDTEQKAMDRGCHYTS